MAKKPSYGKKRGNGKAFTLNVTNLKFIGCAFDEAISDLEAIRTNAIDKAQVDTAITKLKDLRAQTARVCPQNWYIPFETE